MTRIKKNTFFSLHNIECTDQIIEKYNEGRTLEEIKRGVEFRRLNYEAEIKAFNKSR